MSVQPESPFDTIANQQSYGDLPHQSAGISDGYGEQLRPTELRDPRDVLFDNYVAAKADLAKVGLRLTVECAPHVDITTHPDWMAANARLHAADHDIFRFHEV